MQKLTHQQISIHHSRGLSKMLVHSFNYYLFMLWALPTVWSLAVNIIYINKYDTHSGIVKL